MEKLRFTAEQKQVFFDAFLAYRAAGETFVGAYSKARTDFNAAHKLAPNLWTFSKWYKARMNGEDKQQASETATETAETAPETEEIPDEVLAQDEEAAQPADDYTKRLEMICRLYRTRSEAACDAVCDRLLPELWRDEA